MPQTRYEIWSEICVLFSRHSAVSFLKSNHLLRSRLCCRQVVLPRPLRGLNVQTLNWWPNRQQQQQQQHLPTSRVELINWQLTQRQFRGQTVYVSPPPPLSLSFFQSPSLCCSVSGILCVNNGKKRAKNALSKLTFCHIWTKRKCIKFRSIRQPRPTFVPFARTDSMPFSCTTSIYSLHIADCNNGHYLCMQINGRMPWMQIGPKTNEGPWTSFQSV